MGTRHLILVQLDGEYKVAQYGAYSGQPECAGAAVVKWLTAADLEQFKQRLRALRRLTDEEVNQFWAGAGADSDGRLDWQAALQAVSERPELDMATGARILQLIQTGRVTAIIDDLAFARNSLFCEWAYVIDLDNDRLEVYKGFNETPLQPGDRFYELGQYLSGSGTIYYPVRLEAAGHWSEIDMNSLGWDEEGEGA